MAVNNDFYKVMNELVARATNGTATEVVDYDTFVDAGKALSDLNATDYRNNFLGELMNRIARVILVKRSYDGAYKELDRGMIPYGNTIEMIMFRFFEAKIAPFVSLTDGQSVDQWVIAKPKVDTNYYVKTNATSFPVTIERDQLIKAFTSPGEMETFIDGILLYIRNTIELFRETGRIGMVADWVKNLCAVTAEETDENKPSMHYNLLSIYNAHTGAGLTADQCLYNEDFVKFAVATIKKVLERTKKVSESYNFGTVDENGNPVPLKTFTNPGDRHLFVNSQLAAAIDAYVPRPYLNNDSMGLTDYIDVPYWQNEDSPLTVSYGDENTQSVAAETVTPKVLAVFLDRYALGEYLKEVSIETTPYNVAGKYWDTWASIETRYVINKMANGIVFTISDAE